MTEATANKAPKAADTPPANTAGKTAQLPAVKNLEPLLKVVLPFQKELQEAMAKDGPSSKAAIAARKKIDDFQQCRTHPKVPRSKSPDIIAALGGFLNPKSVYELEGIRFTSGAGRLKVLLPKK